MSHMAIMFNMGQVCTAGSRTFVQEEIYDEFVKKATARAAKRTVGDPMDMANENGAQVGIGYSILYNMFQHNLTWFVYIQNCYITLHE